MKLIKETTSKPTDKNGKLRRHGIFECPVCKTHIEKSLSHGTRNKTCGNPVCRKDAFQADVVMPREATVSSYYSQLVAIISNLRTNPKFTLCPELLTMKDLDIAKLVVDKYEQVRLKNFGRTLAIVTNDNTTVVTVDNIVFELREDTKLDIEALTDVTIESSRAIAAELGVSHTVVTNKVLSAYPDVKFQRVGVLSTQGYPMFTYLLSTEIYSYIKQSITITSKRQLGTSLYVVESGGYHKIGIATSVSKRLKTLESGSPLEVTLLKEIHYGQAAITVERYLHNKYKENNHKYEWFKFEEGEIDGILEDITEDYPARIEAEKEAIKEKLYSEYTQKVVDAPVAMTAGRGPKDISHLDIQTTNEVSAYDTEARSKAHTKHGLVETPVYRAWQMMRKRVNSGECTMSDEWLDAEVFAAESGWEKGLVVLPIGNHYSKETCKVLSSKAVMSKAKVRATRQLDKVTGETIAEYESAKEAADALGFSSPSHIGAVCMGKRKTAAGYKWEFI